MELHNSIDDLTATGTLAVAISQEDKSLEEFARFQRSGFDPAPRFELVADLERAKTERFHRTSTYLVDANGVIRQIFPMLLRHRASWKPIIDELRRSSAAPR